MATSKKFSELPAASSVGNGDLFAIAHEDAQAETGYVSQKLTAAQAGQKVNGDTEYPTGLPSFPTGYQNPFDALEKLNSDIEALYPVVTETGSIANFSTSLALPLVACKAQIVAQQAGTGTPSPSNPRAISGYDEVVLTHCGINLWDEEWEVGTIDPDTGATTPSDITIRSKNFIPCVPNTTYYAKTAGVAMPLFFYDANKNYLSRVTKTNNTFTTPADAHFIKFRMATDYGTTYTNDISINYPSTDTSYHAYNSQSETKTIALGQTVYGGYIDNSTGRFVITHTRIDMYSLNWQQRSAIPSIFYAPLSDSVGRIGKITTLCEVYEAKADKDDWSNVLANGDGSICIKIQSTNQIAIVDSSYSSASDLKSDLNNKYLVYELATPIEITGLTPDNFTTFAGEQNIFADSGDVEVSYKQGIQEYIDAKIAETQALIL